MPRVRRDGQLTRQRLLDSASELFAADGYRDTTVARICGHAKANVAAVNYHFGDKEGLYRAALAYAFELASLRYPIDGGLSETDPAELRLQAYVEAQLRRTFCGDRAGRFPRLVVMEMAEPTGVVGDTLRAVLRPHREHLRAVLRELLGEDAGDSAARLCVMSIISQCYFFAFNRALRERHFGLGRPTEQQLRELIVHIARFCLAGIADARFRTASSCAGVGVGIESGGSSNQGEPVKP